MTPVAGHAVTRVRTEFLLDVQIDGGWGFQAESTIEITTGGRTVAAQGESLGEVRHLLAALVGTRVTSFEVGTDGTAVLVVGETTLTARPDPDFESWNVVGPLKERVVCGPGGRLTTWSASGSACAPPSAPRRRRARPT